MCCPLFQSENETMEYKFGRIRFCAGPPEVVLITCLLSLYSYLTNLYSTGSKQPFKLLYLSNISVPSAISNLIIP